MLPKIKRFVRNNKKQVKTGLLVLLVIIILLVLYKSLFYSSSEKSVYGVRIRDINNHEFTVSEKKDVQDKVSSIDGVEESEVVIKGRLIKFFVTFKEGVSTDDMKAKFSEILNYLSDDTKTYSIAIKGDTSGDANINIADLLKVQKHILGYINLSGSFLKAADVNSDGSVDIKDLLIVQKHILGYTTIK